VSYCVCRHVHALYCSAYRDRRRTNHCDRSPLVLLQPVVLSEKELVVDGFGRLWLIISACLEPLGDLLERQRVDVEERLLRDDKLLESWFCNP
jgi:hypothetical protein